ncbi:response regulator transcription factor [Oscillatoriales cyanobacterium LEGE 11467]|uniref:Response regulator transcription factor n=2 Tax=Zarconia TaxID=2992130 RepID=A0A928VU07_9CYAN|nr:response regulator transcription factor [Zarconia navalis LEGE 11467]
MNQDLPEDLKILVVDDHDIVLDGTLSNLKEQYPEAEFLIARTARETRNQIERSQPHLVIFDLSIPEDNLAQEPKAKYGIQVLREMMQCYPELNLTVQTTHVKTLIRIKQQIDIHQGGFTIVDKKLASREMLVRVNLALQGATHTRDLRALGRSMEFRPEWTNVLKLAFEEGLQDRAIAERINVSPRTVLHYWTKIRDVLGVYSEEGKNLRIQTEIRAREEGLID